MNELSAPQLALLDAVVDEGRPLPALGLREGVQPLVLDLLRRGYVELREAERGDTALSLAAAELALDDSRSWESGLFSVRATEAGARAWETHRADHSRAWAELEREARHLRGF